MIKSIAVLSATAAVLIPAAAAQAAPRAAVSGVVVAKQHGLALVAGRRGAVHAVRAGRFAVGARVVSRGGRLVAVGTARHAVVRGIVVRRQGSFTFLSVARHVLAIRAARTTASNGDSGPAPGTVVTDDVGIDDQGDLDNEQEHDDGAAQQAQIQATVTAVSAGTVTLSVGSQTVTLSLPAGLTLPSSVVGTQVTLTLSFANGGVVASDDDQADQGDQGDQGDQDQGDDNDSGDGSGSGSGSSGDDGGDG